MRILPMIFSTPTFSLAFVILAWLAFVLGPDSARAEEWMFRRSYYSHHRPPEHYQKYPPPRRRTAYRPAYRGTTPGFAIRGAYRYNRIQLGRGRNSDVTIYRQDWFEEEP